MEPTYHSLCLNFWTTIIRFWFPWVRLMECKAVKIDYPNWDEEEENDIWQQKEQKEIGKMK